MLLISEALKLTDEAEIRQEIDYRRKLIREMVGWLYPSILQDEMNQLSDRLSSLQKGPQPMRKVLWDNPVTLTG